MNGLELSRAYYEACGAPMLEEAFSDILPHLAGGLCGSGSECLGYDDALSRDHDFEPGFCLFLPDESVIDRRTAFRLERAYARLPRTFMGVTRGLVSPVGGPRRGVFRLSDFFISKVGAPDGILAPLQWLSLPDQALLEATNGAVFFDNAGTFTETRERLNYYPEDIRRKKLAGALLMMAQSGQYNYLRCLRHGERGAAQLAAIEFVAYAFRAIFLINRTYQPYYKWQFRALRTLPELSLCAELFEYLLTTDNDGELSASKAEVIEGLCADVVQALRRQGLTNVVGDDLERHAYSVNDGILNASIRALGLPAGVI